MASLEVYQAIVDYLSASWTETPISLENTKFTPPVNLGSWIAVELTGSFYGQESIGADPQADNRWDEDGTLWIHVLIVKDIGSFEARRLAGIAVNLFRGTTLMGDQLEFLEANIGQGGPGDEDGNYWRLSVAQQWRKMAS